MPESVSQSIRTSSARRRNGLSPARSNRSRSAARGHADGLDRLDAEGLDEGLGHGASCTGFSSAGQANADRGAWCRLFPTGGQRASTRAAATKSPQKSTASPTCDAVMPWRGWLPPRCRSQPRPPRPPMPVQRRDPVRSGAPARAPAALALAGRRGAVRAGDPPHGLGGSQRRRGRGGEAAGRRAGGADAQHPAWTARCGRKAGCAG